MGGEIVSKAGLRVEAYGTVDELNSAIGMAIAEISNFKFQISNVKNELIEIQKDLFEISSALAAPVTKHLKSLESRVSSFEKLIDELDKELPEISNFILPGGSETGSLLHFARTICRRTERRVVELSNKEDIDLKIIIYLNRLSDLLFIMARYINTKEKQEEIVWNLK
ncbi:MAG: cob(I)yrinic acid a,c-diamide adenosyltransferase [Patescibacteria group bacterium]|nr:cob(I)yrinic acid a,c-diamide adenosyltransferase [Patescibacteria group bacterium]